MVYLNKEQILEQTIEKYSNMVYRLAMARTRNIETSEDVYQEVFLRLAKKMPDFESEEHKKAWLIRVTINCTKSFLNSAFMRHRAELDENIKFETPERHELYYAVLELPINDSKMEVLYQKQENISQKYQLSNYIFVVDNIDETQEKIESVADHLYN